VHDELQAAQDALREAAQPYVDPDPEMVFGVVCPLGTDIHPVMTALENSLHSVCYTYDHIRLSQLLREECSEPPPQEGEAGYLEAMMQAGDDFRKRVGSGAALAILAIISIWKRRAQKLSLSDDRPAVEISDEDEGAPSIKRHAHILRSLKHPDEANLLRSVYGNRFVLVGVSAPEPIRRQFVNEQLSEERNSFNADDVAAEADRLIRRDARDPDNEFGQNVKRTFELADVFVDGSLPTKATAEIGRFIELLFSAPFITPTQSELAMAHAHVASLRSSAAGRQVGAVICNSRSEIISTGCNEVPKNGGGQYWSDDELDDRDFHSPIDPNDKLSRRVLTEVLARLKDAHWLVNTHAEKSPQELVTLALAPSSRGGLGNARIVDLIEFGRIMHAEMAAIVSAANRGVAVDSCTLYTTTFPCHECAKHIIGVGISRVVYISPYAKSLVREMFGKAVSIDEGSNDSQRLRFESFVGVAPRRFQELFVGKNRKDKKTGELMQWDRRSAIPRLASELPAGTILDRESEVLAAFRLARQLTERPRD
jgi:deoxycytidylate deaminase